MSIAYKISGFNRKRKWRLFSEKVQWGPDSKILDLGFSEEEFSGTDNYLEKNYPFPKNITALGIDDAKEFRKRYPEVSVIQYDGNLFPFNNKSFDICWSNAVLEHVGEWPRQVSFLSEIKRVSRLAFITTPNRYFPIEVHTRTLLLHFLPKNIFDKYLSFFGKKWATGNYMNLLSYNDVRQLLKEAEINEYKIFRNKLLFFTMDFVVIFKNGGNGE